MAQSTDLSNLDSQVSQIYGNGALGIPAGSKSQRPSVPLNGMLRWNSSSNTLETYSVSEWYSILNKKQITDDFVSIAKPKIAGDLDAGGKKLSNVAAPEVASDAINLGYLEDRFEAGTGINAESLGGHNASYFATQFDVSDLQLLVADVQENLEEHIADKDNPHETTKAQIGLDQVDNTSDLAKPLSTAATAALYGSPAMGVETAPKGKVNRAGDVMQGALSMGYNNLVDIANFVGMVTYFATANAPAGFLACNGAAVSRTNFSRLFARIGTTYGSGDGSTTFNLPDLRGYFVRGWASGGYPTDPGRTLGSIQQDTIRSHNHPVTDPGHTHTATTADAGEHFHDVMNGAGGQNTDAIKNRQNFAARDRATEFYSDPNLVKPNGIHKHDVTVAGSSTGITIAASGGAETRPMNVALLACIMY